MSNMDRITPLENIGHIVAENLKRLREDRKLSLDAVAKCSGVSKSMLGQIERGVTNPTISTLWKIANGLKISFTSLMMRPETDVEVVPRSAITPFVETDGKYRNYPVFPFDSSRGFEMYAIELDPGVRLDAEPHPEGTQEFITVFSGELTVLLDGERWGIADGDSIRFKADRKHAYANEGNTLCRLSMVICYPS